MKPTPHTPLSGLSAARGSALRLIGVVHGESLADAIRVAGDGAQGITFRDVAALVRSCAGRPETATDAGLLEHHTRVADIARVFAIVPAPACTNFRNPASALQWLELHAVTLADGLAYIDGRIAARVTADRDLAGATSDPSVLPPSAAAIESFRALRRYAAATVPVSAEAVGDGTTIATEAFLIERASYERFMAEVAEEDARSPGLTLRLTGPWPAYDFVRLQF